MELCDLLEKLTAAFGPCGCESGVRTVISDLAAPPGTPGGTDTMGNLIFHREGPGKRLMFLAHMDTVGIIVTHIDESGYLHFGGLGELSPRDIRRRDVIFQNGVRGVITVPEERENGDDLNLTDLLIDIGAGSGEEARTLVRPGDTAVFSGPTFFQNGLVFSRFLDNRAGCAALLLALEQIRTPRNDLYFVFSVQEEVGLRGAKPAAFEVNADAGVCVDVTASDDLPGARHACSCVLGRGPGVKIMDHSVICQGEMVRWMNDTAGRRGIPVQQEVFPGGSSDAGVIQPSRGGVWTGGIGIPCRCAHTPAAVCSQADIRQTAELITALAETALPEP